MARTRLALLLLSLLPAGAPLSAGAPCESGPGPAATLLLPYFEVDPSSSDGTTTLLSVNNATDQATLTNLTFWTDWGIPTISFQVYLTGYDVQTINLRDVFVDGVIPITADPQTDPDDTISPGGAPGWEGSFPDCELLPYLPAPSIPPAIRNAMSAAHRGDASSLGTSEPLCFGHDHGDGRLRGYVTVDVVGRCTLITPAEEGYFAPAPNDHEGVAAYENRIWGDWFLVDPGNDFAHGDALVHVDVLPEEQASPWEPGDWTFYGSHVGGAGTDRREPLPSVFAARYLGGAFDGGTDLLVWRDAGPSAREPVACGGDPPWIPMLGHEILIFDEQEDVVQVCAGCQVCSPPGPPEPCLPLVSQRIRLGEPSPGGDFVRIEPPWDFGWLRLDLDGPYFGTPQTSLQGWISALHNADGRFGVGLPAVPLANGACTGSATEN